MQLLSHSAVLADATVFPTHVRLQEFLLREDVHHLAFAFVVLLVASQIVQILSLWITSKMLVHRDDAILVNALKAWGLNLLLSVTVQVVLGVIAGVGWLADDPTRRLIVVGGTMFFTLLMVLIIPMKVYVIGLLRSLGLLVIAGCLTAATVAGLVIFALVGCGLDKEFATLQASVGKTPHEQQSFLKRLMGREAPDEIERLLDDAQHPIGPKPSLSEREAMVAVLQQKLTARQRSFRPGAPVPKAFQDQLTRYRQFLDEVLAERNATPPTAPSLAAPPARTEPSPLPGATPAH